MFFNFAFSVAKSNIIIMKTDILLSDVPLLYFLTLELQFYLIFFFLHPSSLSLTLKNSLQNQMNKAMNLEIDGKVLLADLYL